MAGSRLVTFVDAWNPETLGNFPRLATLKSLRVNGGPSIESTVVMLKTVSVFAPDRLRSVASFTWDLGSDKVRTATGMAQLVVQGGGGSNVSNENQLAP